MKDKPDGTTVPAAARYKEIAEIANDAAARMRRWEEEKSAQLFDEVSTGQERLAEAEREHEQVVDAVNKRWNSAMEELWSERWMRVTPMPEGDPSAARARSQESIAQVQTAYLGLRDALGKPRSWLSKGRRPRDGA